MTTLDQIQARADAATAGPWQARTAGTANGDHWYICGTEEAIAYVSAQDGINEDQREPDAEFIAQAREDVPKLVAALRAVEAVHVPEKALWGKFNCAVCADWDESQVGEGPPNVEWPCPTIQVIQQALDGWARSSADHAEFMAKAAADLEGQRLADAAAALAG